MLCRSVLVAAAMAALCLGMDVLQPHRQEPVCPSQHSCSSRGTSNASSHLECSCDASCRKHGDCCRDSEQYNLDEQRRNVNEYVCVADTLAEKHVYVKAKCAEDWDNAKVQALCMRGNTIQDTIYDVPVTTWPNHSYANTYCAVCNGEDPRYLSTWDVYMVCDAVPVLPAYSNDEAVHYEDNGTLTDHLPLTNSDDYDIMYNERRWGVIPRGSRDVSAFTPCRTHFVVPLSERRYITECLPTVKTCSDAEADQHDRSLCESYTAAVYHEDLIFRNQHCASCNGYKQFTCVQPDAPAAFPPAHPALTMLLNLENTLMMSFSICGLGEVGDHNNECRQIICPRPDEEFRYGKCVSVQGEATLNNSELLCPLHHSCFMPDFSDARGCSCDATCRLYGDCCRDSQYYDEAEQTKNVNKYECVDSYNIYDGYNGKSVYMRAKCLDKWNNTEVQALCLMGNTQTGDSKQFPVTSTTTAITYVNHYCALCNDEDTASLRMWYAQIECPSLPTEEDMPDNDYTIGFHEGEWGIITPSLGPSSFEPCFFKFVIPEDIRNYTTSCLPAVKTCNDSGADHRDQILCQSYAAAVYDGYVRFRNQHCASCNGYKEYSCVQALIGFGPPPALFAMVLDFSDTCGRVGFHCRCSSGEVWDTRSEKCRERYCLKRNGKLTIEKCASV